LALQIGLLLFNAGGMAAMGLLLCAAGAAASFYPTASSAALALASIGCTSSGANVINLNFGARFQSEISRFLFQFSLDGPNAISTYSFDTDQSSSETLNANGSHQITSAHASRSVAAGGGPI
jgi:hypothetical protein